MRCRDRDGKEGGKVGIEAYLEITIGGDAKTVARTTEMIGHATQP